MNETSSKKAELAELAASHDRRLSVPETLAYVTRAVELVKRFEIDAYEHRTVEDVRRELIPTMTKLVSSAATLVDKLSEYYGATQDDPDDYEFDSGHELHEVEETPAPERDEGIAGLCFVGKLELAQNLQQIREPLDGVDKLTLIARCIQCRGALFKVAEAVDGAICEREGWSRTVRSEPELRESLIVRRVYCRLSLRLAEIDPPTARDARESMQAADAALAEVLSSDVERHLRMSDRFQLLQLRSRVTEWLARAGESHVDTAVKLWQDLTIATELLMQINNRQELVTHDLEAATRIAERLKRPRRTGTAFDAAVMEALSDLTGRDPQLDHWMQRLEGDLRQELVTHLERIGSALSPSESEPEAAGVGMTEAGLDFT